MQYPECKVPNIICEMFSVPMPK
nr:unnamed protein product [Callosobruchus chinensis]